MTMIVHHGANFWDVHLSVTRGKKHKGQKNFTSDSDIQKNMELKGDSTNVFDLAKGQASFLNFFV